MSTEPQTQQPSSNVERDPLELVLTEFTDQLRNGQAPSVNDFAERYPQLADQILELFPLVGNLERWKSDKEVDCLRRSVPRQFSFDRLGDYQLVRELGRGGMGVVFEATHAKTQRRVAIKLLPWRFAANMSSWKERLLREATTIAGLKHLNIVQIYSFDEDQGYPYYVMQFVDGVGLDCTIDRLKRERRQRHRSRTPLAIGPGELTFDAWRGFAKVGEQVALALACAHAQGIVHNDIKPSNLLMRPNGQIIVTDFGIGSQTEAELTSVQEIAIGTLRYMAPERLEGRGDARSDLYSLGVTLYELATQTPLFGQQKRTQLIDAILQQRPVDPLRLIPEMPPQFASIIVKALEKRPDQRYVSARTMAEDLRRFINREPVQAAQKSLWQRLTGWFH